MVFAFIPSTDIALGDRFFGVGVEKVDKGILYGMSIKKAFEKHGDDIHTIDLFKDLDKVDYFLLEWPRWDWIRFLANRNLLSRTVYINAEPPTVVEYNCPEGFEFLKKIFPYIMTYCGDWVDNISVFKRNNPHNFDVRFGNIPFENRKLLTAITADKFSDYPSELYSERRQVYEFFEQNYPKDFDFYGIRWKAEGHPCYKGTVFDKTEIYHKYRFAICLENTKGAADYVTEKIFDCMCAGIVPIYGGAPNILEYVPKECFIDYFSFNSYNELAEFLINMSEEQYSRYIANIKAWLETSDKYRYSLDAYVEHIFNAIHNEKSFRISLGQLALVNYRGLKEIVWNKLVDIKHRIMK